MSSSLNIDDVLSLEDLVRETTFSSYTVRFYSSYFVNMFIHIHRVPGQSSPSSADVTTAAEGSAG